MRTIREVLRLKLDCGLSDWQIAKSTGLARSKMGEYLRRFHELSLLWPLSAALQEGDLTSCLFPPVLVIARDQRPVPDWPQVQAELRRQGVTLTLLWQEYKTANTEGFQYSWFYDSYQAWRQRRYLVMRQTHRAGEKLFVDFCGQTMPVTDPWAGEMLRCRFSWRCWVPPTTPMRKRWKPRAWRTGSAPMCGPLSFSADARKSWYQIT